MQSSRTNEATGNGHVDVDVFSRQREVGVDTRIQVVGVGDWGRNVADALGSSQGSLGGDDGFRAESELFVLVAALENDGGERLVETLHQLSSVAPDAGRVAVTRLAARHAGPEQRARGLVTLNEILQVPATSVLLIEPGSSTGAVASRQEDRALERLFALLDRSEAPGDAVVRLSTSTLVRLFAMRGFIAWREFELEHEMIATGGQWHDRFASEPTEWQPSGFDWTKAQGVLPFAFAPHDWLEEDARQRFDRLVEQAWEEAAPCEMASAMYAGDTPGVGLISFGLPFPTGLLEIRDAIQADRQRIAEKEREAATPIPLMDDFATVEDSSQDGFEATASEAQPQLGWEPPPSPEPQRAPEPKMESAPEREAEPQPQPELTARPDAEAVSEPEAATESGAGSDDSRPKMEAEADREKMPWEPPSDEPSLEVGESTETVEEPAFAASQTEVAVADEESETDDAYEKALDLVRGMEGTEDVEKTIDLAKIRYALYDLLEVLRGDPTPLLNEVFRTDVEGDYFARHHVNVSILSMLTADEAESTLTDVVDVGTAAMIHDIGMSENRDAWDNETRLPPNVFDKAIREHPERGFERLQEIPGMTGAIARMVLEEHERMDGTGYPEGMSGDEIDPGARVIAACDTLEALTHPRPFREHLTLGEALSRLQILGQYTLDADVVQTLTDLIGRWMPQLDSEANAD